MIKCPTCGKQILEPTDICSRCKTEVAILFKISLLANRKMLWGYIHLKKNNIREAYNSFKVSNMLKKSKEAEIGMLVAGAALK